MAAQLLRHPVVLALLLKPSIFCGGGEGGGGGCKKVNHCCCCCCCCEVHIEVHTLPPSQSCQEAADLTELLGHSLLCPWPQLLLKLGHSSKWRLCVYQRAVPGTERHDVTQFFATAVAGGTGTREPPPSGGCLFQLCKQQSGTLENNMT